MSTNQLSSKNEIHRLINKLAKSWNEHDAKMFCEAFADDAEFNSVFGHLNEGRDTIQNNHARIFSTVFKDAQLTLIGSRMKFIKDDVASVDISWKMTGAKFWEGSQSKERRGLMNWIVVYQNKRWEIILAHNTEFPPIPERLESALSREQS